MLDAKATTGAGEVFYFNSNGGSNQKSFQATVSGSGAVTATVKVQVRNSDDHNWQDAVTITLSGTDTVSGASAHEAPFEQWRGYLSAITGTDAVVTLTANK
jgi:hypothetical protein